MLDPSETLSLGDWLKTRIEAIAKQHPNLPVDRLLETVEGQAALRFATTKVRERYHMSLEVANRVATEWWKTRLVYFRPATDSCLRLKPI